VKRVAGETLEFVATLLSGVSEYSSFLPRLRTFLSAAVTDKLVLARTTCDQQYRMLRMESKTEPPVHDASCFRAA
jgi:hypothetical protein